MKIQKIISLVGICCLAIVNTYCGSDSGVEGETAFTWSWYAERSASASQSEITMLSVVSTGT